MQRFTPRHSSHHRYFMRFDLAAVDLARGLGEGGRGRRHERLRERCDDAPRFENLEAFCPAGMPGSGAASRVACAPANAVEEPVDKCADRIVRIVN